MVLLLLLLLLLLISLYAPAVDCGSPPALLHGYLSSLPVSTTYGQRAEYGCPRGYWFARDVFSEQSTCDRQGNWSSISDCVRKLSTHPTYFFPLPFLRGGRSQPREWTPPSSETAVRSGAKPTTSW